MRMNPKQQFAIKEMLAGKNVFLTGGAGVGKSATIDEFMRLAGNKDETMICAPTGVAAINVDGVTCHRAFKIPVKPLIETPRFIPKALKDIKRVIIDEAPMSRIDVFDYMMFLIANINKHREEQGIEPIQVILVGDFFQLSPVITDNDRQILEQYKYGKALGNGFAFQSAFWDYFKFETIELTDVIRQTDKEFSGYLNEARIGNPYSINYFNRMSNPYVLDNAILLCSTNKKVNEKNDIELAKIKAKEYSFKATVTGTVNESDKLVPDDLRLKVGCRVMTVINDTAEDLYQNGTLATVKEITDDKIVIETDDGDQCDIYKHTWDIKNYTGKESKSGKVRLSEENIGTYTQFPLRLGYAITIHKSQGKTLDRVNLDPYCWDYGQLYVALSRVRSISGLHLTQPIRPNNLVCAPEVRRFYKK